MAFSDNLQMLRNKKGLSQEKLAHMAGVSQTAIYQWEKGLRKPKSEQLVKLANALNVPVQDLAGDIVENSFFNMLESFAENYGIDLENDNEELFEITEEYIISEFQKLNLDGQIRLLEHIEDLLKIEGYLKK